MIEIQTLQNENLTTTKLLRPGKNLEAHTLTDESTRSLIKNSTNTTKRKKISSKDIRKVDVEIFEEENVEIQP